jgi:hypothetical protein
MCAETRVCLHVKRSLVLSDFNQNWNGLANRFHENLFSGPQFVSCVCTDAANLTCGPHAGEHF